MAFNRNRDSKGMYKAQMNDGDHRPRNFRRAHDNALLSPEQRKLKGSMREACVCAALAIEAVGKGEVVRARQMAMLAVRAANAAERLAAQMAKGKEN